MSRKVGEGSKSRTLSHPQLKQQYRRVTPPCLAAMEVRGAAASAGFRPNAQGGSGINAASSSASRAMQPKSHELSVMPLSLPALATNNPVHLTPPAWSRNWTRRFTRGTSWATLWIWAGNFQGGLRTH